MNDLLGLIPILYAALQIVSRELVGFIPATSRNSTADGAALNQIIRVPVTPESENQDITPGTPPANGGTAFDYVDMAITKNKIAKPIVWTGDEQISVGSQLNQMMVNQYTQAMRSLVNEVERDVCLEGAIGAVMAGNVTGTAGVTPFAADLTDLARVKKLQDDLGTPLGDRHLIINTATGMALRSLQQLTSVAHSGETDMLRRGVLNDLMGYMIRESGGFLPDEPGTQTSVTLSANAPADAKSIAVTALIGTLNIGAILQIAGKYYTLTAPAVVGATTLNISPEIKETVTSGAVAPVLSAYLPNVAFSRDFIYLATRNPAMPQQANKSGGTLLDMISVTDPVSGLSFQVCLFDAYRQIRIEIGLAWGVKAINKRHGLLLLG
jgi:hypothetical protein